MSARARICLIDDDILVREALTLGLSDAGFHVFAAPGAAAGLDLARREAPHAIVTDMNMPGTSGGELITEVRALWPDLPIVAISGAATIAGQNTIALAHDLGASATLIKPFRARELTALLERLLSLPPAS